MRYTSGGVWYAYPGFSDINQYARNKSHSHILRWLLSQLRVWAMPCVSGASWILHFPTGSFNKFFSGILIMTPWRWCPFSITGLLWGRYIGHRWILLTRNTKCQYCGAWALLLMLAWISCRRRSRLLGLSMLPRNNGCICHLTGIPRWQWEL